MVDGIRVAPKTPIPARAAISHSEVGANTAAMEVSMKPTAPISRIFRLPTRSPSEPAVTRRPASISEYASMIQSCSALVGSSSCAIAGSAKFRIVLSIETRSTGSRSTTSATQARQPARGPSVAIASVERLTAWILFSSLRNERAPRLSARGAAGMRRYASTISICRMIRASIADAMRSSTSSGTRLSTVMTESASADSPVPRATCSPSMLMPLSPNCSA